MLLLKWKSLWSSPVAFRNYSVVVTSCIALLHLKDDFLVDSTKNEEDGHNAFRSKCTKPGAVCSAQQSEGNCFSSLSVPIQLCTSSDKETAFYHLVPFTLFLPSTPKVGEGRGGRGWRRPARSGELCSEGEQRGGGSGAGLSPSSLPSLFSLKFIVKGQHSRVRHVTLSGPAYWEPDHPHRGRWSCLIETGM